MTLAELFSRDQAKGDLLFAQAFSFPPSFMLGKLQPARLGGEGAGGEGAGRRQQQQVQRLCQRTEQLEKKGVYTWFTASVVMVVSLTVFVP